MQKKLLPLDAIVIISVQTCLNLSLKVSLSPLPEMPKHVHALYLT